MMDKGPSTQSEAWKEAKHLRHSDNRHRGVNRVYIGTVSVCEWCECFWPGQLYHDQSLVGIRWPRPYTVCLWVQLHDHTFPLTEWLGGRWGKATI